MGIGTLLPSMLISVGPAVLFYRRNVQQVYYIGTVTTDAIVLLHILFNIFQRISYQLFLYPVILMIVNNNIIIGRFEIEQIFRFDRKTELIVFIAYINTFILNNRHVLLYNRNHILLFRYIIQSQYGQTDKIPQSEG